MEISKQHRLMTGHSLKTDKSPLLRTASTQLIQCIEVELVVLKPMPDAAGMTRNQRQDSSETVFSGSVNLSVPWEVL